MPIFEEKYEEHRRALAELTAEMLPLFRIRDDADAARLQDVENRALAALEQLNLMLAWAVVYNVKGWRAVGDGARELKSDLIGLVQRIDAAQARAHAILNPSPPAQAPAPQAPPAAPGGQDAAVRAILAESAKASAAAARERMRIAQDTANDIFEMNRIRLEEQRKAADEQQRQFIQSIRGGR